MPKKQTGVVGEKPESAAKKSSAAVKKDAAGKKSCVSAKKASAPKKTAAMPVVESEKSTKAKKPSVGGKKDDVTKKSAVVATRKDNAEKNPIAPASVKPESAAEVKKEVVAKAVKQKGKPKILFVGSEAFPFAGTGGLGEVLGSLPRAINDGGEYEARVILPLYESFPQERRKDLEYICHGNIWLSWRNLYCGLFKIKEGNTVYYLIDNEYYFKRKGLYGHSDDGERFAFFCKAVLDFLPALDFMPDVLHCNDWQTALVPIYYKLFHMYDARYANIKTVFTIHNIEYQGWFGRGMLGDVFGIPEHEFGSIEHFGQINLMKGAIDYSDVVSTVSPTYAREILTPEYGKTLDGVLAHNRQKLVGILNGIDTIAYNPETNPALKAHYNADDKANKAVNKRELQELLQLPQKPDVPIIAMITRLASHKGLDIVREAMPEILRRDVQFVLLGTGDGEYEQYFGWLQSAYNDKVRAIIAFDKTLSHRIYAGADIFLMPSASEPCGLSQMMACRYGTIPVVRETGGLADSIDDAYNGDFGTGYRFARYAADDMIGSLDRAIWLYNDCRDKWNGLVDRAMRTDFGWDKSAREYVRLYKNLI